MLGLHSLRVPRASVRDKNRFLSECRKLEHQSPSSHQKQGHKGLIIKVFGVQANYG